MTASLWKNRTFTRLFFSYTTTNIGDWMDMVALQVLFQYVWHADPFTISLIYVAYIGPGIFFGQMAGVLADRWKKLNLMITADFICVAMTLGLVFAPSPAWALFLLLCRSMVSCFFGPSQQALLRSVVTKEQLLQATTLNLTVFQLAKVLGPLIGAPIVTYFSPTACLVVNAVSFFCSALILLSVGKIPENRPTPRPAGEKVSLRRSWLEGWAELLQKRVLLISTIIFIFGMFMVMVAESETVVLLGDVAPEQQGLLGYVLGISGVGAVILGVILTRRKEIKRFGWVLGGGSVLLGGGYAGMGFYHGGVPLFWLFFASLVQGCGLMLAYLGYTYLLQVKTPQEKMGRIAGINNSLQSSTMIAGPLAGGAMVSAFGASITFQVMGTAIAIVGVVMIFAQKYIFDDDEEVPRPMVRDADVSM